MGKYKIDREDVIRKKEFDSFFKVIDSKTDYKGMVELESYKSMDFLFPIKIPADRLKCLLCILWLFGKRISEVLKLKKKDVRWDEEYLYVKFYVLKRKKEKGIAVRSEKYISRRNPYSSFIISYVELLPKKGSWLFPGKRGVREYDRQWFSEKQGRMLKYHYRDEDEGRMSSQFAWRLLKALSKEVCSHLFRHSLATEMAEHDTTVPKLMAWFDWLKADTAMGYVRKSKRTIKDLADRTW